MAPSGMDLWAPKTVDRPQLQWIEPGTDRMKTEAWRGKPEHRGVIREPVEALHVDGILVVDQAPELQWSEDEFDGFHGYDVDRCMQIRRTGAWVVVADVLVHHHQAPKPAESEEAWCAAAMMARMVALRKKWDLR